MSKAALRNLLVATCIGLGLSAFTGTANAATSLQTTSAQFKEVAKRVLATGRTELIAGSGEERHIPVWSSATLGYGIWVEDDDTMTVYMTDLARFGVTIRRSDASIVCLRFGFSCFIQAENISAQQREAAVKFVDSVIRDFLGTERRKASEHFVKVFDQYKNTGKGK